jgi:hypothetical protein
VARAARPARPVPGRPARPRPGDPGRRPWAVLRVFGVLRVVGPPVLGVVVELVLARPRPAVRRAGARPASSAPAAELVPPSSCLAELRGGGRLGVDSRGLTHRISWLSMAFHGIVLPVVKPDFTLNAGDLWSFPKLTVRVRFPSSAPVKCLVRTMFLNRTPPDGCPRCAILGSHHVTSDVTCLR